MAAPLAAAEAATPDGGGGEAGGSDRLPSLTTLARYRARIERDVRLAEAQLAVLQAARPSAPEAAARAGAARLRWIADRMNEEAAAAAARPSGKAGTRGPDEAARAGEEPARPSTAPSAGASRPWSGGARGRRGGAALSARRP